MKHIVLLSAVLIFTGQAAIAQSAPTKKIVPVTLAVNSPAKAVNAQPVKAVPVSLGSKPTMTPAPVAKTVFLGRSEPKAEAKK